MKILIIMDCFRYGGLSKMMNWLADYLTQQKHDVVLCSVYHSDYTSRLSANVKFVSFEVKESASKLQRNTTMLKRKCKLFYDFAKKEQFDLVLTLGDPCLYFVLLYRKALGYKVVVSERVDPYHSRGLGGKIKRKLYCLCDGFVFQTKGARDYFSNRIAQKAIIIPNPVVALPNIPSWNREKAGNSIVYISRYDPFQKRSDVMFKAFSEVVKKYPEVSLEIYGGGYDIESVKKQCIELNIKDNVHFNGVTDNVYNKLIESKVFLFTSDFEGIPNVIIEAMMVGIPIVATDCSPGGADLLLESGKHGYLAACGNTKEIAEKIIYVLENMEEAENKAAKAKESLKRFDERLLGKEWEDYFQSILL